MNLPALVVALLLLSATVGLAVAVADSAFAGARRQPLDSRATVSLSERMVAADGPLAVRGNVLNRTRVRRLNTSSLRTWFPVTAGRDVLVRLDGRTLVERGDPRDGVTVQRVVLVAARDPTTLTPRFAGANATVTLPRRSDAATLTVAPPDGTTVRTVRANGRVVLHDPAGLDGTYRVALSRFETTTLAFRANGSLPPGSVTVEYAPETTVKATLSVTVDA